MPTHANGALSCPLTSREHQVASLVSAGLSNKDIARRLHLAEGTVKTHLHNVYQKARVNNRTALAPLLPHAYTAVPQRMMWMRILANRGRRSSEYVLLPSALVPAQRPTRL